MLPPADCTDLRLWLQANELAQQHVAHQGRCLACGTPSPCRVLEAAQDAMRRAVTPPPPEPEREPHPEPPPAALPPMAQPRLAPPVGARFRHLPNLPDEELPPGVEQVEPAVAEEPAAPVGSRFRKEPPVGRRRSSEWW